jgi:hypothetical protein
MSAAEMSAAGAANLSFGEATIYVGFEQDGQNQNPVFARFDGGAQVYCEHHEQEAPDGRAYGITWDGGPTAYVVYTIVGGGSAFDAKGKGGWLDRYGDGGGSSTNHRPEPALLSDGHVLGQARAGARCGLATCALAAVRWTKLHLRLQELRGGPRLQLHGLALAGADFDLHLGAA